MFYSYFKKYYQIAGTEIVAVSKLCLVKKMMRKDFSWEILKLRILATSLITIMNCIYDYIIMTHCWMTYADGKTINDLLWLLLLIIHLWSRQQTKF